MMTGNDNGTARRRVLAAVVALVAVLALAVVWSTPAGGDVGAVRYLESRDAVAVTERTWTRVAGSVPVDAGDGFAVLAAYVSLRGGVAGDDPEILMRFCRDVGAAVVDCTGVTQYPWTAGRQFMAHTWIVAERSAPFDVFVEVWTNVPGSMTRLTQIKAALVP